MCSSHDLFSSTILITLHFNNSHLILTCNLSTVYNLIFLFAATSAACFLDSQMPFDLNWIGKDWEVPRIKNNPKYLEKYKLLQVLVYGHLRFGRRVGCGRHLSVCRITLPLSHYLWVNSRLINIRPFSFTCKNIQVTTTWSEDIQPNFNKAVEKKNLSEHQTLVMH